MPLCTCRTQKLNTGTLTRAFYLDDEYLYIPLGLTVSRTNESTLDLAQNTTASNESSRLHCLRTDGICPERVSTAFDRPTDPHSIHTF